VSDTFLRLVPVDPQWTPSSDAADAAVRRLINLLPAADHVSSRSEDGVVFSDLGEYSESISCPGCRSDLGDWWADAMNEAYVSKFNDLAVVTPCYATRTSLNDLVYEWPAAFGSFCLEAFNPNAAAISDADRALLEETVGAPLRVILQRI
jgi:hypothetical protein